MAKGRLRALPSAASEEEAPLDAWNKGSQGSKTTQALAMRSRGRRGSSKRLIRLPVLFGRGPHVGHPIDIFRLPGELRRWSVAGGGRVRWPLRHVGAGRRGTSKLTLAEPEEIWITLYLSWVYSEEMSGKSGAGHTSMLRISPYSTPVPCSPVHLLL